MAFSLVKVTTTEADQADSLTRQDVINAILKKIVKIVRVSDIVGEFGKNEIVVLLSYTPPAGAREALRNCLEHLYTEPLEYLGVSFSIKMAGVAVSYSEARMSDGKESIKQLSQELMQMEIRIRNIQDLIR